MRYLILLLAAAALLPACAPTGPSSATVTPEQFHQIHWILGKWRGTFAGGAPFFESYLMMDDSTIAQATWSDSTFTNRSDSSVISLRNGRVTNGSAVATEWNTGSVHFESNDTKANSYTWRTENADRWIASQPVSETHELVYIMTRVPE
jgi:hypothetical protein